MSRVPILLHDRASIGSVPEWVEARGYEVSLLRAEDDWQPPDLTDASFLISMGSTRASYDATVPWLARELEVLGRALAADVPILGICFGSQVLARALGSRTGLAPRKEIEWIEVETLDPDLIDPGPWLFWHEDRFVVPAGAELLARTPVGPAAFRAGRNLGIQFHPEITPAALDNWLASPAEELTDTEVAALRAGMDSEGERAVQRAWALYDNFLHIAGLINSLSRQELERRA